jgi:hypothetical protein
VRLPEIRSVARFVSRYDARSEASTPSGVTPSRLARSRRCGRLGSVCPPLTRLVGLELGSGGSGSALRAAGPRPVRIEVPGRGLPSRRRLRCEVPALADVTRIHANRLPLSGNHLLLDVFERQTSGSLIGIELLAALCHHDMSRHPPGSRRSTATPISTCTSPLLAQPRFSSSRESAFDRDSSSGL